jgi:hypothetical protein
VLNYWRSRSKYEKALFVLFLLTLPFVHPRVTGDGIGYYAYLRSPLIDHNLRFAKDWDDPSRLLTVYLNQHVYPNPLTRTGHLPNFYTVGPAILWLPFVGTTHVAVLLADRMGAQIPPDGHSWPYLLALSGATALYGLLGLYCSFLLGRKYMEERWAFWATIGIWFASSLPVYMYLEPSWSHAHSALCVALVLWYGDRTRPARTAKQWIVLGLIAGLMIDVYLTNVAFLVVPALDCLADYKEAHGNWGIRWRKLQLHVLFAASFLIAFAPLLITREIVYGNPFTLGMYGAVPWNWKSPAFRAILFSSEHGLFVCTPILATAVVGLFLLWRRVPKIGGRLLLAATAFYCLISVYPWWHGIVAFGNRFFVSLTPVFVLGLAALFSWAARFWKDPRFAARRLVPLTAMLVLWNLGLIYQWSEDLFPRQGPVYWNEIVYNQFGRVPGQVLHDLAAKFSSDAAAHNDARRN